MSQNPLNAAGILALCVSVRMNYTLTRIILTPILMAHPVETSDDERRVVEHHVGEVLSICERNALQKADTIAAAAGKPDRVNRIPENPSLRRGSREERKWNELRRVVEEAEETAIVLDQIVESAGDIEGLGQELYSEINRCRSFLQDGITQVLDDEKVLATLLSLNDRLEITALRYDKKLTERALAINSVQSFVEYQQPSIVTKLHPSETQNVSTVLKDSDSSNSTPLNTTIKLTSELDNVEQGSPSKSGTNKVAYIPKIESIGELFDVSTESNDEDLELEALAGFTETENVDFDSELDEIDAFLKEER
ncbi:hypothetical protein HK096_000827 [Nowakowskiella sp. JEL0078]|nr:hypothetical protein HK096_000827 [Nowakowskiella sp. JEL0078]